MNSTTTCPCGVDLDVTEATRGAAHARRWSCQACGDAGSEVTEPTPSDEAAFFPAADDDAGWEALA